MSRQRVVGIKAAHLRPELHPIQLQAAQLLGFVRVDLALHPHERGAAQIRALDFVEQRAAIQMENAGELIRHDAETREFLRIHAHRLGRHALGERLSGAIQNGPAHGGQLFGALLLLLGETRQIVVVNHLKRDQSREDSGRPEQ